MWTMMLCWTTCFTPGPIPVWTYNSVSPVDIDTFVVCKGRAVRNETLSPDAFKFRVARLSGEHQMELLDFVAAKFHEEGGVFKLLVSKRMDPKTMFTHIHHSFGITGTSPSILVIYCVKLLESDSCHFLVCLFFSRECTLNNRNTL